MRNLPRQSYSAANRKMWLSSYKTYVHFKNILYKSKFERSMWIRQLSTTMANKTRTVEERKIKVDGTEINYARVGTGDHQVLLLPGALGTIWTDFKPQMENLDTDKLTIVAWDPPGYGKSRPPDRTFPENFFQRDATYAHNLMKTLGYKKFSLIGWSDGGITSLIISSMYPESIRKMVVFGANSYIHPNELKIYESVRDIDKWSEKMRAPMIQMYGEDYFRKIWSSWIDGVQKLYEQQDGDICKQVLSKIKCPTLIIHGTKDAMVLSEHSEYLKQNIADSRLHIFEKGAHNLHLRYPEEFNKLVMDFLVDQSKM